MKQYTIYCTEEQCEKALKLGAPIETRWDCDEYAPTTPFEKEVDIEFRHYAKIPTAEQMIGWLDEQYFQITLHVNCFDKWCSFIYTADDKIAITTNWLDTRKEATLAAISSALEYLTNNKK